MPLTNIYDTLDEFHLCVAETTDAQDGRYIMVDLHGSDLSSLQPSGFVIPFKELLYSKSIDSM
jgi:hypothetical protein